MTEPTGELLVEGDEPVNAGADPGPDIDLHENGGDPIPDPDDGAPDEDDVEVELGEGGPTAPEPESADAAGEV